MQWHVEAEARSQMPDAIMFVGEEDKSGSGCKMKWWQGKGWLLAGDAATGVLPK
jgi:hypothetical protein